MLTEAFGFAEGNRSELAEDEYICYYQKNGGCAGGESTIWTINLGSICIIGSLQRMRDKGFVCSNLR